MRWAVLILLPMVAACNPGPADRADAQPPRAQPPHSVAREESRVMADVAPVDPVARGHERYAIFCAPCHGVAGLGDGPVVERGFPAPPSFSGVGARTLDVEAVVEIIARGQGKMRPMGERIPPADRSAIAAYVMTLKSGEATPEAGELQ